MDIQGRIPRTARNFFQVEEVNLESRSETISRGKPCSRHMSLANIPTRSPAVLAPEDRGMKCAISVNRQMTTGMLN